MKKNRKIPRGRIPTGEKQARQQRVLQAAMDELVAVGYENTTMLGIAKRANCSKATLYDWFTDQQGLFAALIKANGDKVTLRVEQALAQNKSSYSVLVDFSCGLLQLLCSDQSIALNRAGTQSMELANLLLQTGRFRVGPIIETYLESIFSKNKKKQINSADAFRVLYGLIVQDSQIRVLLGEQKPNKKKLIAQATQAVDHLYSLYDLDKRL